MVLEFYQQRSGGVYVMGISWELYKLSVWKWVYPPQWQFYDLCEYDQPSGFRDP